MRLTAPRCDSSALASGLEISGGTFERRSPAESEKSFQGRKVYVSPRPVVDRNDIKRLILEDPAGPFAELEASGIRKLAEISSRGAQESGVVLVGGKVFNVQSIRGPISGNRIQLVWSTSQSESQARKSFAQLCAKVRSSSDSQRAHRQILNA